MWKRIIKYPVATLLATIAYFYTWFERFVKNRGSMAPKYFVVCEHCKHKFDYLEYPEVAMGYKLCPKCGWAIDQSGQAWPPPEQPPIRFGSVR